MNLAVLLVAFAISAAPSSGQTLCFDEAHQNAHTSAGRYAPFAALARGQGYEVVQLADSWTESDLSGCSLVVSVSPRGAGREGTLQERARPAFTDVEVSALVNWLSAGRSFLLITDHPPIGSAAQPLASRLGIDMSRGFVEDPEHSDPHGGHLVFSRSNGLLASHPITDGLGPEERVDTVGTFLGQSLAGPPGAVSILTLGSQAKDRFRQSTDRLWLAPGPGDVLQAAGGRSQGIAFSRGTGRVVVLGDAAMLTSLGANSGFDPPGLDNRQFAINILRWLSK
jgi:hypothetical protein